MVAFASVGNLSWILRKSENLVFFKVVQCPYPKCSPIQQSMCGVPPPSKSFPPNPIVPTFKNVCAVSHPPSIHFFLWGALLQCRSVALPDSALSWILSKILPTSPHPNMNIWAHCHMWCSTFVLSSGQCFIFCAANLVWTSKHDFRCSALYFRVWPSQLSFFQKFLHFKWV